MLFEPRTYRAQVSDTDLVSFVVREKESDLLIRAKSNLARKAAKLLSKYRKQIEAYISRRPEFTSTLEPLQEDSHAPEIVRQMLRAGMLAGVGPMAGVAGAIAERVGKELLEFSTEVIVENGGDIFLKVTNTRRVAVEAGASPLSGKMGIEISPWESPCGVCTSSGTRGHSLSMGCADAATVVAKDTALADASATALGNKINNSEDLKKAVTEISEISGLTGCLAIMGDKLVIAGKIHICDI
jgi:hypothetical protein